MVVALVLLESKSHKENGLMFQETDNLSYRYIVTSR